MTRPAGPVRLRPAGDAAAAADAAGDAATIARLHAESWQASYDGILPDDYLRNEVAGERAAYWRAALQRGDYGCVWIADAGDRPVGFIALKYGSDADYDAVIEHLHVLPGHKGRGLGRRLIARAVQTLAAEGMTSVCLRVFDDNAPAIAFYERLGGITDDHGTDQLAGSNAPDRRIGWRDIAALRAACGQRGPA